MNKTLHLPKVACLFAATMAIVELSQWGATASEFNSVLNVGDAAPGWSDLPGTDGKQHSSEDFKDKKATVVIFTCNSCPVAQDYEDRIVAIATKHASDVAFVAINSNRIMEDNLDNMKKRAAEKKFPFAYLFDESQQVAKSFGATTTPHFFVLSPDRKIIFMGGMDDNSDPKLVKEQYLEPAIQAALEGKAPAVAEAPPRGCGIRFVRERKPKAGSPP